MPCQLCVPVLFLVFNRPDTTQQVFESIRQVRPSRLYIASDGPRPERPGEAEKVQAVRDYVVTHIDWPCEVKTLFRDNNLGCRLAVGTAIDWFFENEPEGIILEDDCLPDPSFFSFAEELLAHYRDDERVMIISGDYFHGRAYQPSHSYFFSRHVHIWGWASWRRAWRHYDHEMKQWPALRNTDWLLTVGDGNRDFQRYWTRIFDTAYSGEIDSWAYRWVFSCWAQSGLGILPSHNLVTNIGFGKDATHTTGSDNHLANLPTEEMTLPLLHPPNTVRTYTADRWTDLNIFHVQGYPLYKRILGRAQTIAKRFISRDN
jgi:hypothetical protein